MRILSLTAIAAVIALSLAAPAVAQDNVSGLTAQEGAQGLAFYGLTANNNYFATRFQCTDATGTSTAIGGAIADCCIAGDIWRVTVFKGTKQALFKNVANTSQFVAGAPAFAPGVYSPDATILTKVKKVDVIATMGNQTPGGLPAGGTLRVTTNGGPVVCTQKQLIN